MTHSLHLRPVSSDADRRAIVRAVAAAGAKTIAPTHVMEREGKVVGYFSLNAVPLLTGWMHDDLVSAAESKEMFRRIEAEAEAQGLNFLCAPCTSDCRFRDEMETLGYHKAGVVTLNLKAL